MWLIIAFQFILMFGSSHASIDKCEACSRIVEAFERGLERTARANFGGGNTHWEESRLGTYAFSETRLVDIVESLCKDESKEDGLVCHSLVEGFEEAIEAWWAKEFKANQTQAVANMRQHLCVQHADLCCPYNSFGPKCAPCPSAGDGISGFCSNHGHCEGNGTKSGSGNCSCDDGYTGVACSQCASGYYGNSTQPLSCDKCHIACSECFGPNRNSCSACAKGFEMQHTETGEVQCNDVNECDTQCKADHEVCTNTEGSFRCECAQGYHRVDGVCQLNDADDKKTGDVAGKEDEEGKEEEQEEEGKKENEKEKEGDVQDNREQEAAETKDEL